MTRYILPMVFIGILFSGCISVTKELPPFSTYTLLIDKENIKHTKKTAYSIGVLEPKSLNSTNNILISYSQGDYTSENYALSKWSDKPTKMLQHIMVTYLSETNNYNYVHGNRLSIPSDIHLLSELDSFTQYLDKDKAYVKFALRVFLVHKDILYTKKFSYRYQCDDQSAKSSVKAMNKAVNLFLRELDSWIVGIK